MKLKYALPTSKVTDKKVITAVILSAGMNGYSYASDLQSQILSFEEPNKPNWITASNCQLSQVRAIHGDQSIHWQWTKGDSLTIDHSFTRLTDSQATSAYGRGATQVLSFWLYNPVAVDDSLTVELADNGANNASSFPVKLNFTGWRAIGVSLNADFIPAVTDQLAKLTFHAPSSANATAGSLNIDRVMVSVDDNRYQWSDAQVSTRYNEPEIVFALPDNLPAPTQAELDDADTIKQTLISEFSGNPGSLTSLETRFSKFGISKDSQGNITGRHVLTDKQQVIYQPAHLLAADKADFDNYVMLGDSDNQGKKLSGYAQLMLDIAKAYNNPAFSADEQRLAEMYRLMTEHLLDQGFADGSALVTSHHWGYSGRWWYISALMMADELAASNLLQPTYRALLWFSREFKDSFDMALNSGSSNLDYFNTLSRQHLALLLLNPDNSERIALLHTFSAFFSGALNQTPPGTNDGLRPDGTAWRHNGHYPGYAFSAFENAAHVAYILKDTGFSLSNDALDNLKSVMVAGWHYSNPYVPLALSGRHPFTDLSVNRYSDGLKWLANSYPSLNEELAAIYLQVTNTSHQQSSAIFGKSITPASLPEGSWSFNGGAFAIHRNGNRMAVLKGYNKDVWSSEIYTNDNRYGRYQSHGSAHVIPYGDPTHFGYQQEGWDWNRNPGATTIHLDYDSLESPKTSTLMVRSDNGISGSTSLKNQYSLFTFKHKAPQTINNFEPSFEAEKHVLAAGDKLFLTGAGISNSDGTNRTETTLFQLAIGSNPEGLWINGVNHKEANFSATLSSGDWLIDDNNVGYYLMEADNVQVRRGSQVSRHNKSKAQTSGEFTSAWIDHGVAPNNASYQYVMVMETTPTEMTAFANAMNNSPQFSALERSDNDQVLFDRSNQLYGYSSTGSAIFNKGPVKTISTTAQVLAQLNDKEAYLSIASPELNLQENDQPTPPVTIVVEIDGEWNINEMTASQAYSHHNGKTRITVESLFGSSVNLTLTQGDDDDGNNKGNSNQTGSSGGGSTSPLMLAFLGLLGLIYRRR
ncbi:chondroitinase family polysaccharide lyase [uncultured Photobacterium sp.]|uniref:chondroitinase family polysaccharide lyase n=1 Tax=uncultured Photobacterium sp. TaxID=173973 RepID=UPI002619338A|nr:chondroitinase family polysaccharide lyase [uncultured Photobacterium sp.]